MFLRVACLALLQLIFYRGYSFQACSHDSDCPRCNDHHLLPTCANIRDEGHPWPVCHCNPVVCMNDSDCPCQHYNFHAICFRGGTGHSYCGGCHPVHCDPSPCLSSQICVVETYQQSSYFNCRWRCNDPCSNRTTCVIKYVHRDQVHECIDPCVPNPCSSGKTCVNTNDAPFYVCEAQNTTESTSKPTDSPTTKETSTSSPVPTPAPQQSDCSKFNITLHGCRDSSACLLPHILEVLCPDPQQAKYCPTKCGCCPSPLMG
ncbi:protein jagged-1-like isoform X2 [Dreissena polymorpha]|uniref:protein jagged-1-like isoform X2 n=1 Tax=Dreissena polymorpha TaxID=45954 RepID=UPI0022648B99|nr:protein jagged-1-like isoform X2 [Dreissena polymorpha]